LRHTGAANTLGVERGATLTTRNILLTLAGSGTAAAVTYSLLRRRKEPDLRGQVVLITGGSRGLGLQLAREFAAQGCRIVICARNREELARAQSDLQARGAEVLPLPCDITDRGQVRELLRKAAERFGAIDILVNNAGTIQVGPVQHMTVEDFENAMSVMFWGTVYPSLEVLPEMLARKRGRIVNITSIGGKVSVPHLLPYTCAKFAAVAFSEGLRAELGRDGISVVTIVPGLMRTGSYQQAFFKGQKEKELSWFGLGASLPGMSMSAARAARQIVRAAKRGDAERILSLPAIALAKLHGVFPGLTNELLSLAARLILPDPGGQGPAAAERGKEVQQRMDSRTFDTLTRLGRSAGRELNQQPV
jgi:NAD(P)-dependent dehydrogenase (short-subunit alcohol dehydrogenase family)